MATGTWADLERRRIDSPWNPFDNRGMRTGAIPDQDTPSTPAPPPEEEIVFVSGSLRLAIQHQILQGRDFWTVEFREGFEKTSLISFRNRGDAKALALNFGLMLKVLKDQDKGNDGAINMVGA